MGGSPKSFGPVFIRITEREDLGAQGDRGIRDAFKVRVQISMSISWRQAGGSGTLGNSAQNRG